MTVTWRVMSPCLAGGCTGVMMFSCRPVVWDDAICHLTDQVIIIILNSILLHALPIACQN
jgi:hypothetical protein